MKDPKPINLLTTAEVRELGWRAEARDDDGHLISTHAGFETDRSMIEYLKESFRHGESVTIFAPKK